MATKNSITEYCDLWSDEAISSQVGEDLRKYRVKVRRSLELPIYPDEIAETLWGITTVYPDHVLDESGSDVLACYNPSKKTIEINISERENEGRVSFTIAHEVGHISMHSFLHEIFQGKTIDEKSSKQLDKQADKYASLLLMPEKLMQEMIKNKIGSNPMIDLNLCGLDLMETTRVSRQALEIRLCNLGYKLVNSKYGINNDRVFDNIFTELEGQRRIKQSRNGMV